MSQLAGGGSQPKYGEELDYFLRRLETVRFQADGWQEPYESRGSRTVAWGTGGEIPPVYPTEGGFFECPITNRWHSDTLKTTIPSPLLTSFTRIDKDQCVVCCLPN
jgi:hypothetical protein